MLVDLNIDVEHGDGPEELGAVVHRGLIILLNDLFTYVFFNLFLGFLVIWVCVPKPHDSLLFFSMLLHKLLHPVANDFLEVPLVA